jgi:hypothetical protein
MRAQRADRASRIVDRVGVRGSRALRHDSMRAPRPRHATDATATPRREIARRGDAGLAVRHPALASRRRGIQEPASRNARGSGAWIRVWGEADDRRRIGGFAKARPRVPGRARRASGAVAFRDADS